MKKKIVVFVCILMILFIGLKAFTWHMDNFIYLPGITALETENGITVVQCNGNTYVIEIE
jgi:hypothetical protein